MNTRTELKLMICSMNKCLKKKVHEMNYLELLCNVHPLYRGYYALKLLQEGKITRKQASKFTKFIK